MADPTDENLKRARELVEETPSELQRSDRIDLCQDITKALSDAEQRGRAAGIREAATLFRDIGSTARGDSAHERIMDLLDGGDDEAK